MLTKQLQFKRWPAFSLFLCFAAYASAQSTPTKQPTQQPTQNSDIARTAHDQHRDINREELAHFNQPLQTHRETAEQLRKDPSLADNRQFLKDHPALQSYLRDHPATRDALEDNPDAFMRDEDRFEHVRYAGDQDGDRERRELASFNQFLDSHRETAEQLRKDPSLADNQQFLKNHPALQSYLQDHPEIRQQLQQDPNAFMRDEDRYDRREDATNRSDDFDRDRGNGYDRDRYGDRDHDAQRHFGEFLGSDSDIATQLSKDPSSVRPRIPPGSSRTWATSTRILMYANR